MFCKFVKLFKSAKAKTFSEKDLISFGLYLLSKDREDLMSSHPEFSSDTIEDRKRRVYDSDLSNWKQSLNK